MAEVAAIIRLCYEEGTSNDEEVAWRVGWMEQHVLPRIRDQRDVEPPDIWLWVHPRHRGLGKRLGVGTFLVDGSGALEGRHPWSRVRDLPRYRDQLRLDSDDLIGPRYVRTMLDTLDREEVRGGRRIIAHAQPYKVDVRTGRVYMCFPGAGRGHYSPRKISAFMALRQDVKDRDYEWVYSVGHTKLYRIADQVAPLVGEGYCWAATGHGFNDSTEIYPYDKQVGRMEL